MFRSAILPWCFGALAFAASANQGEDDEACALQLHTKNLREPKELKAVDQDYQVRGLESGANFTEQCEAWVANLTTEKPSACAGVSLDGCYKGLPPIAPDDGAWCVAGKVATCEEYCNATAGLCPENFCGSGSNDATFTEQCEAWVANLTTEKPSACAGVSLDGCYKGLPPIAPDDGAWCVAGKVATCEEYCNATAGLCPEDSCGDA